MEKLSLLDTTFVSAGFTDLEMTLWSTLGGCLAGAIAGAWVGKTAFTFGEVPGGIIGGITGVAVGVFIAGAASILNLNYGANTAVIVSSMAGLSGLLSTNFVFST